MFSAVRRTAAPAMKQVRQQFCGASFFTALEGAKMHKMATKINKTGSEAAGGLPKAPRRSLDDLADDDAYYFVDTNIISAYVNNEIPSLNRYIDRLSSSGPHFFVTDRIAKKFKTGERQILEIPPQFKVYANDDADKRADFAYPEVMKTFSVNTENFGVDMRWLLECGHCLHSCEDIPLERLLKGGHAFALTLNVKLVNRFLRSPEYRKKLERIVDDHGLEHLADMRLLHNNGTFEDLSAFR